MNKLRMNKYYQNTKEMIKMGENPTRLMNEDEELQLRFSYENWFHTLTTEEMKSLRGLWENWKTEERASKSD